MNQVRENLMTSKVKIVNLHCPVKQASRSRGVKVKVSRVTTTLVVQKSV